MTISAILRRVHFLILVFTLVCGPALAQSEKQEAELKAVFIYNFTKYIDWEEENGRNDFTIAVLGSSVVTQSLTEIAKAYTVKNKKIIIKTYSRPGEIQDCDILFIPKKSAYPLQLILDRIGSGVLTISEEPGFATQGTALNFILVNDKLKFEANLDALSVAGLRAGSQLLKLAIIVK